MKLRIIKMNGWYQPQKQINWILFKTWESFDSYIQDTADSAKSHVNKLLTVNNKVEVIEEWEI